MSAFSTARLQVTPNVTPMIDVMLVLLIILMVTLPAMLDGAAIPTPDAMHVPVFREKAGDHVVGIDHTGALYLNKKPIAREKLRAELASRIQRSSSRVIYIRAEKSLAYGVVREVWDIARASGAYTVGMITETSR